MKRLTGTNKEIAELLYQEQLELSKNVETRPFVTIQLNLIRLA